MCVVGGGGGGEGGGGGAEGGGDVTALSKFSLISSRSFIKGGRKPENPGEKTPDHP